MAQSDFASEATTHLFEATRLSPLCSGIDPDPRLLRAIGIDIDDVRSVRSWLLEVVEILTPYSCALKFQRAFFDLLPQGHEHLKAAILGGRRLECCTILDAKIGDTANTMHAYRKYGAEILNVDHMVCNPYMGSSVWARLEDDPVATPGLGLLVRSSNSEGHLIQDQPLQDGSRLYQRIWDAYLRTPDRVSAFPVFSHTDSLALNDFRRLVPDNVPILFAGFGAQAVNPSAAMSALSAPGGGGVFATSSRSLVFDPILRSQEDETDWRAALVSSASSSRDYLTGMRS